jgi:putative signal transducing protein
VQVSNWSKVYESKKPYRAEIVKDILDQKGIMAIIMDKKDTAYDIFGHLEVHVKADNVISALKIIEDDIKFEEV